MEKLDPSYVVPPEVTILARQEAHKLGFQIFDNLVSEEGERSFRPIAKPAVQTLHCSDRCDVVIPWDIFMVITAANLLNPPRSTQAETPVLHPGFIYSSDNGRLICVHCAGQSAKFTGYDLSGDEVIAMPMTETIEWKKTFGTDIACECGKTTYPQPPGL